MRIASLALALTAGCAQLRAPQDPSGWFDAGSDYDVSEPLAFTDQNYDFTGDMPVASMPVASASETLFAVQDAPANDSCQDWETTGTLPVDITGVVTIFPRYYYKAATGCSPSSDIDSDEKFYGSYFLQDASGGTFVLGDTKVAEFLAGATVTLHVRAVKDNFGLKMVNVHDLVEVDYVQRPIFYEEPLGELDDVHVARVVRVEGVVDSEMSTFGEVYLLADDGTTYKIGLDQELTRRGVEYPLGARLRVTGPVIFSFEEYTIVLMQLGQIEEL